MRGELGLVSSHKFPCSASRESTASGFHADGQTNTVVPRYVFRSKRLDGIWRRA